MGVDSSRRTLNGRVTDGFTDLFQEYPSAQWSGYLFGSAIALALLGVGLGSVAGYFPDMARTLFILAGMFGALALLVGALGLVLGVVFLVAFVR